MATLKVFCQAEMAEIEADLDALEALLRRRPRPHCPSSGRRLRDHIRPRPRAFARAIVDGLKPLAAALQAGYRAPNRMTVWRLLRDPKVKAEIDRLKALP